MLKFNKKKKGNIYVTTISMIVGMLALASILNFSINDQANIAQYSRRIANRYTVESSVDLACYLVKNKLNNKDITFRYLRSPGSDWYYLDNEVDSYIFDEVADASNDTDEIQLTDIEDNVKSYLYANGFAEFGRNSSVEVKLIANRADRSGYKIVNMAQGYNFMSSQAEPDDTDKMAKIDDLKFLITAHYAGGDVRASITLSDVYVHRGGFKALPDDMNSGYVSGYLDTSACKIAVSNYQNYLVDSR